MQTTCKYCEDEFSPKINHPGLITVCLDPECQQLMFDAGVREPDLLTAEVAWSGKHTMEMRIVDDPIMSAKFNNIQRRFGVSVMASLTAGGPLPLLSSRKHQAGYEHIPKEVQKLGTRGGDAYYSKLGETRHVKR